MRQASKAKTALERLGENYNRPLTPEDRERLAPVVEELRTIAPELMARKIPDAVFQQAFCFDVVRKLTDAETPAKIGVLVVGGFEDPVAVGLASLGYSVTAVDPAFGQHFTDGNLTGVPVPLSGFEQPIDFDFVVVCSTIEHEGDDMGLMTQVGDLLTKGGVAVFTTDYKKDWRESDPKPPECARIYSAMRLYNLLDAADEAGMVPVGKPSYHKDDTAPYFTYAGVVYGFAAMVLEAQ